MKWSLSVWKRPKHQQQPKTECWTFLYDFCDISTFTLLNPTFRFSVRFLVHEMSGRFGHLSCSPDVAMSNFEIDNLELQLDNTDLGITASGKILFKTFLNKLIAC